MKHYNDHGGEVGAESASDYEQMAMDFANDVNTITNDSFVDQNGSTYKYSYITGEFVIVKPNGIIITYFIPDRGEVYWNEQKRKHRI